MIHGFLFVWYKARVQKLDNIRHSSALSWEIYLYFNKTCAYKKIIVYFGAEWNQNPIIKSNKDTNK